jgi:signal transduction histidine kinase
MVIEERAIRVPDGAIAAALAVVVLLGALIAPPSRNDLDLVGYLLLVAAALSLAVRRRMPVAVLAFTAACGLAYQLGGYPGVIPEFPLLIALFTAVDAGHRLVSVTISSVALFGGLGINLALIEGETVRDVVQRWGLLAGWLIAAKLLGEVSRHRRGYLRQVEQRAIDAERTREETALRRASEERLRIARELHDSLTHYISLIKVQAGVAVHLARKRGEEAPPPLLAIQDASREAMRELRATLEVLRAPDEPYRNGLALLPQLIERARGAGLAASISVIGEPRTLPVDVDAAVYRIVQEALTNVSRHAGCRTATVRVEYRVGTVTVQVDDDGDATPGPPPEPGVGLTGMRERVTVLGGRLEYGPRRTGGFSVRAELPIQRPAESVA